MIGEFIAINMKRSFIVILIIFIMIQCTRNDAIFERTKPENVIKPPENLVSDYNGDKYLVSNNYTIRFGSTGDNIEIISNGLKGQCGIFMLCKSPGHDFLEVYKTRNKTYCKEKPIPVYKSIKLKPGLNQIFLKMILEHKCSIYLKSRMGKECVYSQPIVYRNLAPGQRENIFLLSVDTMAAKHLGLYGAISGTGKNITRFSKDSVTFLNTFANSTWTVSSHMSLFTSLPEYEHNVMFQVDDSPEKMEQLVIFPLSNSIRFLIEPLSKRFVTISFNGGINLSPEYGFYRGFDFYYINKRDIHDPLGAKKLFLQTRKFLKNSLLPRGFYFLHTYQLHTPYNSNNLDLTSVRGNKITGFDFNRDLGGNRGIFRRFNQDYVKKVKSLYIDEIKNFDHYFGQFIEFLKSQELYDNAMIILTSDHGEEFLEHGSWVHGTNLYNEQLKVPLIIKFPKNKFQGLKISKTVNLVDIIPTIFDYYNIDLPKGISGVSLLQLSQSEKPDNRTIISSLYRSKPIRLVPSKLACIRGNYKLIYNQKPDPEVAKYFLQVPPQVPEFELYNLKADPWEQNNIIRERIKVKHFLIRIMNQLIQQLKMKRIDLELIRNRNISQQLLRKLKTLGYID